MAGRFRGPLIVTSLILVSGAVLVLSCAGLIERPPDLSDADILLARAKKALDRRNYPVAEKLARDALEEVELGRFPHRHTPQLEETTCGFTWSLFRVKISRLVPAM